MISDAARGGNPETDHSEQPPELPTPRHREQLLLSLPLEGHRNRTLLAALLREIAKWAPRQCYASQDTLARMFHVDPRTIKRALGILSRELGLVVIQRRGRTMADGASRSINHYSICWATLARLVADSASPKGQPAVPLGEVTVSRPKGTVTAYQSDSYGGPRGQLGPTKVTASCPLIEKNYKETTTDLVVVELEEVLAKAADAVRLARSRGLSDDAIRERYRQWQGLPEHERQPGRLYNWLAVEGSYSEPAAEPEKSPLRGDAMPRAEVAAERIRYGCYRAGRRAGATDAAIERAIQRRLEAMTA